MSPTTTLPLEQDASFKFFSQSFWQFLVYNLCSKNNLNSFAEVGTDILEHKALFTRTFIWVMFMEYFVVRVRFHRTIRRKHILNPICF